MELAGAALVTVPGILDHTAVHDLRTSVESAQVSSERVIVLVGGDEVFCDGMGISFSGSEEIARTAGENFAQTLEILRSAEKPTIALVRGRATGGGVGLAAACDAVLAENDATFALPELLMGLAPAVILPYLAQRVSAQKLRWWALTAATLSAAHAEAVGLADAVCGSEKAQAILKAWVRKLSRLDPNVVRAWKSMTIGSVAAESRRGIEFTLERLQDTRVREGLRAFQEAGVPPWIENNE